MTRATKRKNAIASFTELYDSPKRNPVTFDAIMFLIYVHVDGNAIAQDNVVDVCLQLLSGTEIDEKASRKESKVAMICQGLLEKYQSPKMKKWNRIP